MLFNVDVKRTLIVFARLLITHPDQSFKAEEGLQALPCHFKLQLIFLDIPVA